MDGLERFVQAQADSYARALRDIKSGRKTSHWMWYIFPQLSGLGHSQTARYYAIRDRAVASEDSSFNSSEDISNRRFPRTG